MGFEGAIRGHMGVVLGAMWGSMGFFGGYMEAYRV